MTKQGVYLHKKGNHYRVLFNGILATNGQDSKPVVVYLSMKNGNIYVRDEVEFNEPGRFTFVEEV